MTWTVKIYFSGTITEFDCLPKTYFCEETGGDRTPPAVQTA